MQTSLHHRWLLLADASQPLLDQAGEFFLPVELDLGVAFRHPDGTVAGDFRCLNARPADLLPPRNIGAPERMRPEALEVAALRLRGEFERFAHPGVPQRKAATVCP